MVQKSLYLFVFVCEGLGTTSGILIDTPTTDDSRNTKNELNQAAIDSPHLYLHINFNKFLSMHTIWV